MSLTAGTSGHVLIKALKRAGWGNLSGPEFRGVRGVYTALVEMIDGKTGQGKATAWQIAEQAGYTERWTRRCLLILEELELIEWQRGGVVDGKPVPSWFRVSKRALLILIHIARTASGERRTAHQAETRDRIAKYRLQRTRGSRKRRSVHAEVSSALLSIEEVPRAAQAPDLGPERSPASREAIADAVAGIRARLRAQRGKSPARDQGSKTATTTEGATQSRADLAHTYAPATAGSSQ